MKLKLVPLLLVFSLLLSACGAGSYKQAGDFDFDDAMKNIYLDGKRISLPCTLEDLGKDFTFKKSSVAEDKVLVAPSNEGEVLAIIQKGDDDACFAVLSCGMDDDYNEKSEITGLLFYSTHKEIKFYDFLFYDKSKEEILNFFGNELQLLENIGAVAKIRNSLDLYASQHQHTCNAEIYHKRYRVDYRGNQRSRHNSRVKPQNLRSKRK